MSDQTEVIQIYREVLSGSRKRFPNHFFTGVDGKQRVIVITCHLIGTVLQIADEDIPEKVSAELLWKYRLRPPAQTQGWNFSQLMEHCYPEHLKAWHFHQVSNGYWQNEDGMKRLIEAIRFVIEEECQIPVEEIPKRVTHAFFKEHNLYGAFNQFGQSTYETVNAAYPGRFYPWQFHTVPMNYWKDSKNVESAMKWLVFDVLKMENYDSSWNQIQIKHFVENDLQGLLIRVFHNRIREVQTWITARCSSHATIVL
ncbi:DUF4046 domain-containing protein [Alicyclobacillus tolerans]|uniref:DUF4046 domain-containing protein n=1 Tax=Alicyclobacillus tolerans TaxID=90970 RepID=UPI001F3A102F|nr:DUF4046 domain-containing protein [Alicyclobacillus tolerans]MCF8567998.1 DUF4046 domain-containing protein [Alicyclobacillus tolerans]